ncbi:MAG: Cytochrome b6-f complex iron-sulfur subunit [Phycisphaerae bacterium]|nr:Cytochrome b6-f complex iron-sulfur subunit [Phycisphaerae bacterium]
MTDLAPLAHAAIPPAAIRCLAALLLPLSATAYAQPVRTECADCHRAQATQFAESIHGPRLKCQECHGGPYEYRLEPGAADAYVARLAAGEKPAATFDHGASFRGKAARKDVPEVCGTCHADVGRMNAYGLRTDQLASYWVSGHGRRLKEDGDERVAVCIDCHGSHDVLRHDNPKSRTYFQNVPTTCGHCHADRELMRAYNRSADIVEQYKQSIHGRNLLERSDSGSPNCATCHGSHAAAPPGVAEVGHVCGKCHQQIEQDFATGVHARLPLFPRCVGCHAKDGVRGDHRIGEATPPTTELVNAFAEVRAAVGDDETRAPAEFARRVRAMPDSLPIERVCSNCHATKRPDPHAQLVASNDLFAMDKAKDLAGATAAAQYQYARAAERVERLGRGVLLVKNEALSVEEIRGELMSLNVFLHTMNAEGVRERLKKIETMCAEVHAALDVKELGLTRRHQVVGAAWIVILIFGTLMYRKYLLLRAEYVRGGHGSPQAVALPLAPSAAAAPAPIARRRFLDNALRGFGALAAVALLWPALAYVFPARRRGGADERASAGKQDGWAVWEMRKVALGGKAVGVIRTEQGFRAFSLVCTHLGCIVHWNSAQREFECPCHAAKFDADGRVLAGPPPSPLPAFSAAVVQGDVIVSRAG